RRRRAALRWLPEIRGQGSGRADLLGGHAQGAAAAVPARRMAWQGSAGVRALLLRRSGAGQEGDRAASGARQADRGRGGPESAGSVANGSRSDDLTQRGPVLVVALFCGDYRPSIGDIDGW